MAEAADHAGVVVLEKGKGKGNPFELREAVRTLSMAVTRAREIHRQSVEGPQNNYARMVSSLGHVDLKCTRVIGKTIQ